MAFVNFFFDCDSEVEWSQDDEISGDLTNNDVYARLY